MIEAALQWAAEGVPVIPLRGKIPATSHGVKDATIDERQIGAWWTAWPEAGVGGAMGDASDVWVLDLDGPEGIDSLRALESEHGELPVTRTVKTGGGGLHLWFRMPEGRALGNRAGVRPGVDVRGTGGYVVLPPSIHPSGARYELVDDHEIVDAPAWLLDLVCRDRPKRPGLHPSLVWPELGEGARRRVLGMVTAAVRRIGEATKGTRNDTVNRECFTIGGYLDAGGVTVDEVAPILEEAARAAEQHPSHARRALEDGRKHKRPLPPDSEGWRPVSDEAQRAAAAPRVVRAPPTPPPPPAPPPPVAPTPTPAPPPEVACHETAPDGRPYLVVPPGHTGGWFVATSAGGYGLVRESLVAVELRRHWPELPLTYQESEDGPRKRMRTAQLFERYGIRAEGIYYTYLGDSRFRPRPGHTGDLYVRVIRNEPIPAVRHDDVLAYFGVLFGDQAPVMLDWLSTAPRLDRPTGVPVLLGRDSLGKSMIPTGLARFFGDAIADYDDVFKNQFNDAILRSPIVWLDETTEVDARSGRFRKLAGNTRHSVEGKGTPSGTLIGCPRLIVTANNSDPLKLGREDLDQKDENAIGVRIIMVDCCAEAAEWLRARGGWDLTQDWVTRPDGGPGKIPETIAWLAQTRNVQAGSRFLVSGNAAEWAARIGQRAGLPAQILEAFEAWEALDPDRKRRLPGEPFFFPKPDEKNPTLYEGKVVVSSAGVRACWRTLMGGAPPTHRKMGEALEKLSGRKVQQYTLPNGDRRRGYLVECPVDACPEEVSDG